MTFENKSRLVIDMPELGKIINVVEEVRDIYNRMGDSQVDGDPYSDAQQSYYYATYLNAAVEELYRLKDLED